MKHLLLYLLLISFVGMSGCIDDTGEIDDVNTVQDDNLISFEAEGSEIEIISDGMTYPAYTAAPSTEDKKPAIILIHSFNGLEKGYIDLTDEMAAEGYVVLSPEWQTYETSPSDAVVEQLIRECIAYLETRPDVDIESIGLTGFCAGGRYTMLLLPEIEEFKSGVAWYGFPYSGGDENRPEKPSDVVEDLNDPMLIIHGTNDQASNISDIYRYARGLDAADKYFELKIYQGEPHGFMLDDGQLSRSFAARDAYWQMTKFFDRTLKQEV